MRRPAGARVLLRVVAGVIAFGMGCGESTAPPAPVASVSLSPATVDLVPGGTDVLQAIPKDAAGNSLTDRITTWSSSDASVVSVAAGVLSGVAVGTATITATIEGISATKDVTVKDGAVVSSSGLSFSAQSAAVTVAVPAGALTQTRNITVAAALNPPPNDRLMPGTAYDFGPDGITFAQPVTITIKYDPLKLTAGSPEDSLRLYEVVGTSWRVVAGSSANTAAHTVSGNVSHFTVYGVLMQPRVETVAINRDTTVQVHKTFQYTALLKDNEQLTLNRTVTWTSSNTEVVSIDANGLATSLLPGESIITATSEGKSATAKVTVVPGPPTALAIVAGDGQTAAAGSPVATLPAVKVTDAFGNAVSGFAITFAVASGGGALTGGAAPTNSSGIATVGSWTLGTTIGPNTLTASGAGLTPASVTFSAKGVAGSAARVVGVSGITQSATAGGPVGTLPSVKVTDANDNPVPGFAVDFGVGPNSGTVTGGNAITDSSGIATIVSWVLGTTPGAQTLVATAGAISGSPVIFAATAVAPIPSRVVYNGGDGQSALINSAVPTIPAVRVVDAAGIGVPGFTVTFAVTAGDGSVTGGDAVTNVNGFASVGSWVLGPTPGPNTLTATAGTLSGSPITFNATGIAPTPVSIAIFAGNQQSANSGTQVPIKPAVIVKDAQGRGVPGVNVVFSIGSGSGSITGASTFTNTSGVATVGSWTLGIGENSLLATAPGLAGSPVTFVAVGTVAVQVVTFGDSNTDLGFSGTDINDRVSSYVSSQPSNGIRVRLGPNDPNSGLQLAGKIEFKWRAARTPSIRVANHGIAGTTTGAGRDATTGAPNAQEAVNGVTRFQGEVLGMAYPWSGGEPTNFNYPNGPVRRVQAFQPRNSDFMYLSMGTNDVGAGVPTATILSNLETMVDQWIALGRPANHVIITTLPPRPPGTSSTLPALNDQIRSRFGAKGARVISIDSFVSNDKGLTWKSSSLHVGDSLHYSESVREWIADQVVSIMSSLTP
jgi:GDSL-like lipase/acylhydrolase family protein/Big-like domain-containing protein